MRKYIGTYRVQTERDLNGDLVGSEFTYLTGTGTYSNSTIYRLNEDTLILYICGSNALTYKTARKHMINQGVKILKERLYEFEADFIFHENDLNIVCEIIKAKTLGAKIKPESIKNHPRYKEIKQEKLDAMTEEQIERLKERGRNILNR